MVKYIHVIQKSKPVSDSLKFMHKSYISYNKYQCEFLLWLLKQRIWFLLLINIASSLELTIDNRHPLLAGLMSFTNAVSMGMALLLLGYCTGGAFRTTVILCPNKKGVMFLSKLTEKICVIIDAVGSLFFVFLAILSYFEEICIIIYFALCLNIGDLSVMFRWCFGSSEVFHSPRATLAYCVRGLWVGVERLG